jgi:hypothetical protein
MRNRLNLGRISGKSIERNNIVTIYIQPKNKQQLKIFNSFSINVFEYRSKLIAVKTSLFRIRGVQTHQAM